MKGIAAVEAELAHLDDVGVIDGRSEARLVDEHGEEGLVALEMAVGSLHGDERRPLPLVGRAREVHRGHPARRELEEQLVGADATESGVRGRRRIRLHLEQRFDRYVAERLGRRRVGRHREIEARRGCVVEATAARASVRRGCFRLP
jgi:hypothetical protein